MTTNDNNSQPEDGAVPDAHGHAALLLVESLMHALCENATLTTDDAIEITERAVVIQAEYAEAADEAGAPLWRAHQMLTDIAASLKTDRPTPPTLPQLVP